MRERVPAARADRDPPFDARILGLPRVEPPSNEGRLELE
jgi:hypothetical protein